MIFVVPLVGTWIETWQSEDEIYVFHVVPLVGTWIETEDTEIDEMPEIMSFPSWERGLKRDTRLDSDVCGIVVPLVGTWIETRPNRPQSTALMSFPSWERGLKLRASSCLLWYCRRSPRGNVD